MANTGKSGGGVAAGHDKTVEAAAIILEAGGNAWDAALAAMAAACVVEPVLASPGGGGFMLARAADQSAEPVVYDFFAHTPQIARPTNEVEFYPIVADFGTAQQEFHVGAGAVAVPGMVAGMAAIHDDFCTMPMVEILEPAISLARNGTATSDFQSYLFGVVSPIYDQCPESLSCFGSPEGGLAKPGDILSNPGLADIFEALAQTGASLFYEGEIAQKIVDFAHDHGGHITQKDLSGYEVIKRVPLRVEFDGTVLLTNPAPSTGGILIAFGLQLLDSIQKDGDEITVLDLARVMEATNHARLESGLTMLEQSAFHKLRDAAFLTRFRDEILAHPKSFRGTTHISVIDAGGNAAAVTLSNGEGCGRMLPGTGYMLNNMLGEEDINPRGFHNWPPATRMCSMMAPSLIIDSDGQLTALGSGGSNRIRTAILQVVRNIVVGGMGLEMAIDAPRIHSEIGHLSIEGFFPDETITALSDLCPDRTLWPERNMFFGGVHAVSRTRGGDIDAVGDSRRGGAARVIDS
jgi:gamma-glutamyltranspeptidase / glutathione hydrolase